MGRGDGCQCCRGRLSWETARGPVLNALQLPTDPDALLAEHTRDLDPALRHIAGRLTVEEQGRLHQTIG